MYPPHSRNNETSDAVACQKVKAAERTIGTITKPTIKKTDYVKRNIVEFCCGENSKVGQSKYQRDGCTVTRFTLEDDVTTNQGSYKAIEAVRSENGLLWASISCTGGSPWQNINAKKPGGPDKIKEHKRLFNEIWTSFKIVANECRKHGGRIAIEWPKGCEYWLTKHVKQYIHDLKLNKIHINGCALGLAADEGVPILKPCTIATDGSYVQAKFQDKLCPGKVEHPVHIPVAGEYTKMTEEYTDQMVRLIQKGRKSSVFHRTKGKLGVIVREVLSMPVVSDYVNKHRPRIPAYMNVFNGMVVRTVRQKEVLNAPAAMKAMDDEWGKLYKQIGWDPIAVNRERDDVAAKARYNNIKVHFGDIFGICGAKGGEFKKNDLAQKWKDRFVFRRSDVKDEYNEIAIFDELSGNARSNQSS